MTKPTQQHGALRACLVLLLAAAGCMEPVVTYGERHPRLRPKATAMRDDVTGGASAHAGAGGAGGLVELPPEVTPPDENPAPNADAGSIDADVPTNPIDAGVIPEIPDVPDEPRCEMIPIGLLEPTTDGAGLESGCAQRVCGGNAVIDGLDLHGLGIAFEVYDPSEYQGCTAVFGDLVVHNYLGEDLSALSCLEMVSGSLLILGAPSLASLGGLEHLQYVTGNMSLGYAASYASDVGALADISALSRLHVVLGSLAIHAPTLTSLHGLERLRAIGDTLEIGDAAALYDLTGLAGLRAIGGDLVISGASGLRGFSGTDALEMIGGSFYFGGSAYLRACDGALASVACVGGRATAHRSSSALDELGGALVVECSALPL